MAWKRQFNHTRLETSREIISECVCVCVAEPQSHPPMKDPLFKVCDFTMITAAVISCEVFNDRKLHFNDCSN